ncbi:hypothetical protein [Microbacterium immunditiarum]|uniref:YfhO family protein n=1 Tax=Microbacterium immunditiarum TaxID=337480 RepID=A0A7Y9GQX3_9MICO|nr:hypothetical protein [Microbacterium immunditiarum]NYE21033.1 hypothetical protein [Microbacterium immunditiarum]
MTAAVTEVRDESTDEPAESPAGSQAASRRRWLPPAAMLLVTFIGSLLPLIRKPGFYFWDDTAGVAVGVWQRIAQDVLSGQSPFLQTDMWRGGDFIAEAATGMWNPVMLGLMIGTYPIDDVGAAITVAKILLFLLTAGGVYVLARSFGATPWLSAIAGATLSLSGWAIFMDGSSWVNGTAITAFTPWAWWALRRAYKRGFDAWSIVLAAVLCYLAPSTGNPYGVLTLAIVFLAVAVEAIVDRRPSAIGWLVSIGVGVVLTVVIVYLPFVYTSAYGFRANSGMWNDEFLSISLSDLMGLSSPTHRPYITMFGGTPMGFPGTYLGWFVLPLLPWLHWRGARMWARLAGPLVFGAVFLLFTLGPSQFGMFRWPARLVPFLYLAVILVFAVVASRGLRTDRRWVRSAVSAGIILLGAWIAWADVPGAWKWHALATAAVFAGTAVLVFWAKLGGRGFATITAGLLVFLGAQLTLTPSNRNVADYEMPSSRSALAEQFADRSDGLTVQVFDIHALVRHHPAPERWDDLLAGNMPSVAGFESTTAYSGIGFTAFDSALCLTYNGGTCAGAWDALWEEPSGYDVPLADLLNARYVVVLNDYADVEDTPPGWTETESTSVVTIFERDEAPGGATGTISFAGDDVDIASAQRSGKTDESVEVTTGSGDTRLTFARIAWPGHSATFDGEDLPVEIGPAGLLSVELPENASGTLSISFAPPGLLMGAAAAGIGVLILAACAVVGARRRARRSASPTGRL